MTDSLVAVIPRKPQPNLKGPPLMPNRFSQLLKVIDARIERFLLGGGVTRGGLSWLPIALAVILCAVIVAAVKFHTGSWGRIDLFMIPVVIGCFFFRRHAALVIFSAIGCDFLVSWQSEVGLGQFTPPSHSLVWSIASQGLELVVLGVFVSFTMGKWVALSTMSRRTEEDLMLAKALQSSLTNSSYALGRVAIEGTIHQCSEVGGDFFYFRPFEKKMVTFCLGDVMGKGISASLMMSMVMSFVYEWGKRSIDPTEVCARLNHRLARLWDGKKGWFLTIFYAIFDEESGRLAYCAAGQQGGFLIHAGGAIELLNECDPPIGVLDPYNFELHEIDLVPGDRIVLFTDGVSEARSPSGELFGTDRVARALASLPPDVTGRELVEHLDQQVLTFTGGVYTDDTAILHFQYLADSRQAVP